MSILNHLLFHVCRVGKLNQRSTRSSDDSNRKYVLPCKGKTTTYQRSFLVRVTRTWNILANEIDLTMDNLNSFKHVINEYYFASLALTYDPEVPRTFKTICCKCNTPQALSALTVVVSRVVQYFMLFKVLDPLTHPQ